MLRCLWNRVARIVLVLGVFTVAAGCAGSRHKPTVTGDAESLALLQRLQAAMTAPNPLSGTFTYTMSQDNTLHFAEKVSSGQAPLSFYNEPKEMPPKEREASALKRYVDQTLAAGLPKGTHVQQRRYEQAQQGELFRSSVTTTESGKEIYPLTQTAWDGDRGLLYQPSHRYARDYSRKHLLICYGQPCAAEFFSLHVGLSPLSGSLTSRREQLDGRDLVVLRLDTEHDYREFYLDPQENLLPRRIIYRAKERPREPDKDVMVTTEYETGRWISKHRAVTYTVPLAVAKLMDWHHAPDDMDTTIDTHVKQPDGRWFVTHSTTSYPFSRRTEVFEAQNVSFAPVAKETFTLRLPSDVRVRD